ncbi:MAG TPA: phospholipase A2 family protein [Kofleriaceae bacterium]|nr:phospholipase A2 family protein [Kofleriaceae bacterium]
MASIALALTLLSSCAEADPEAVPDASSLPPPTESTLEESRPSSLASTVSFGGMIGCVGLDYTDYWDYGCYCGSGGAGSPVDATDSCCFDHDGCWGDAPAGCDCYGAAYEYSCDETSGTISCAADQGACAAYCCACDKTAADCFDSNSGSWCEDYDDWSDSGNPGAACDSDTGKSFACQSGYLAAGCGCSEGSEKQGILGRYCETKCSKPDTCDTGRGTSGDADESGSGPSCAEEGYARCVEGTVSCD